jgi:hypothetical protein
MELIKHLIGVCGEPHPSLISLLMTTPFITYITYKLYKAKKKGVKKSIKL